MFGTSKNAFWEALLLTIVVFLFGLFVGMLYESSKIADINEYYARSELSLMDIFVFGQIAQLDSASCPDLISANVDFANKIYGEALLLDEMSSVSQLTGGVELAHTKYDLLRTFLWANLVTTQERCDERFDYVIYLYDYGTDDLVRRATQQVWSKVLLEVKAEQGDRLILVPIGITDEFLAPQELAAQYNVTSYPAVIINGEIVLSELTSSEDISVYLSS